MLEISRTEVIMGLESVLHIEYKDVSTKDVVKRAIRSIENAYQVDIKGDVEKAMLESSSLIGSALDSFVARCQESLKNLAFINNLTLYNDKVGMKLRDVNYLGLNRESLMVSLKLFQHHSLYEKRGEAIESISRATSNLQQSEIKRLLTIMLVLEGIGLKEGVAVVATNLYIGDALDES